MRMLCAMSTSWWLLCAIVHAEDSAEVQSATQFFEEARGLMEHGDYAAACEKFAKSERSDPQLGTLLHLADCEEKLGKIASAWRDFNAATSIAAARTAEGHTEAREGIARQRAALLEMRLSWVRIHADATQVSGLQLLHDGQVIDPETLGRWQPVDPGQHAIVASAPERKSWTTTYQVDGDKARADIRVPALEPAPIATPLVAQEAVSQPPPMAAVNSSEAIVAPQKAHSGDSLNVQRLAGYGLSSLGVVGLGIGTYFGLRERHDLSQRTALCPGDSCSVTNDARVAIEHNTRLASANAARFNWTLPLSCAALLGGIALVLTLPEPPATEISLGVGAASIRVHGPGL